MKRQDRKGYVKLLYEQHLERLKKIKSTINNSTPPNLLVSKKWENEYNRKIDSINDSNNKLVNRLTNVRSLIDNKPDKRMKEIQCFKNKMILHKRNMEMEKLVCENIILLDRLKTIISTIKM
jgi:hypothetical protein